MNTKNLLVPKSNLYFLSALLWTFTVIWLSLADVGGLGNSIKIPYKDKMVHFVFYFLLFVLWATTLREKYKLNTFNIKLVVILIFFGILMEVIQGIMHFHRSADWRDAVANSIGAIVGLWFYARVRSDKQPTISK